MNGAELHSDQPAEPAEQDRFEIDPAEQEFDAIMARYDRLDRVVATVVVSLFGLGLAILAIGRMFR